MEQKFKNILRTSWTITIFKFNLSRTEHYELDERNEAKLNLDQVSILENFSTSNQGQPPKDERPLSKILH